MLERPHSKLQNYLLDPASVKTMVKGDVVVVLLDKFG
jgi:hypothetical protein